MYTTDLATVCTTLREFCYNHVRSMLFSKQFGIEFIFSFLEVSKLTKIFDYNFCHMEFRFAKILHIFGLLWLHIVVIVCLSTQNNFGFGQKV